MLRPDILFKPRHRYRLILALMKMLGTQNHDSTFVFSRTTRQNHLGIRMRFLSMSESVLVTVRSRAR